MAKVWSDESKLAAWLEVELAALDAWAELGVVPRDAARSVRERATPPTPDEVEEIERRTGHDLAAFVDAVPSRRGGPLAPLRAHLLRRRRHRPRPPGTGGGGAAAGGRGARARGGRRPGGGAPRHGLHRPDARRARGTDDLRREARRLGVRARPRARSAETRVGEDAGRQAVGGGRHLLGHRPRGRAPRLRAARARARAGVDADRPARPARGALVRARARRRLAGALRARDPPPRAYRGARGAGAVRAGAEGLLGDAAQAQPGRRRADLRAGAGGARRRPGRPGERRPLARTRHLALVRRARRHPGRVPRPRLHARPVRLAGGGARRPAGADAREPRGVGQALLLAAGAPRAGRGGPGARRGVRAR